MRPLIFEHKVRTPREQLDFTRVLTHIRTPGRKNKSIIDAIPLFALPCFIATAAHKTPNRTTKRRIAVIHQHTHVQIFRQTKGIAHLIE